jgi:hypothetical protein
VDDPRGEPHPQEPRLPKKVILVYELPTSAVHGAVLQANDLWSGDKATIRLGI